MFDACYAGRNYAKTLGNSTDGRRHHRVLWLPSWRLMSHFPEHLCMPRLSRQQTHIHGVLTPVSRQFLDFSGVCEIKECSLLETVSSALACFTSTSHHRFIRQREPIQHLLSGVAAAPAPDGFITNPSLHFVQKRPNRS